MREQELACLTGAQQITVMENLTQQAAAWLVGATARTVRDHVEIPRDSAGRYSAQNLLAWAARRVPPAELTAEELERTLNAADLLFDSISQRNDEAAIALCDLLEELNAHHGEGGLVVFAKEALRQLRQRAELELAGCTALDLMPEAQRREIEQRIKEEAEKAAREWRAEADLDFAVVCDGCGMLRQGREWVKADPSPGRHVIGGCCPDYPHCNPHWPKSLRQGK